MGNEHFAMNGEAPLRLGRADTEMGARARVGIRRGFRSAHALAGILALFVGSHHAIALAGDPVPVAPAGSDPSEDRGSLRVHVDSLIEDAPLIPAWVMSRHPDLAERLPSSESGEQWIAVEITGVTYDYRVSVVAMRDGELVAAVEPRACECTNEDLLTLVDEEIEKAIGLLGNGPVTARPDWELQADQTRSRLPLAAETLAPKINEADVGRSLGWLGYTGIGASGLGIGLMATGIPLALQHDRIRVEGGEVQTRSTRGMGVGLAMVGGTALAVGAGLFILEKVQTRKRSLAATPAAGRGQFAVVFTGRF